MPRYNLLLLIALLVLSSCQKELIDPATHGERPIENDYLLAEGTFEVNTETKKMLQQCDSTCLIFEGSSEQLDSIRVGDILVSGVGPNAPFGYLRRAEEISKIGNRIEIKTSEPTLDEAFERLRVDLADAQPIEMGDVFNPNSRAQCFTVQFNADSVKKYFNEVGIHPFNLSLKACGSLVPRYKYVDEPGQPKIFEAGIDEAEMDFTFGLTVNNQLTWQPSSPVKLLDKRLAVLFYGPLVLVPTIEVLFNPSLSISNGFKATYNKGFLGQKYLRYDEPSDQFVLDGSGIIPTGRGWEYVINLGTVTGQLKLTIRVAMKLWDSDNTKTFIDNSGSLIAQAKAEVKNGQLCFDASLQGQLDGALGGQFTPFGITIFNNSFELYKFNKEFAGFGTCRPENVCIHEEDFVIVDDRNLKGVNLAVERLGSNSSQFNLYANEDPIGTYEYEQSYAIDLFAYAGSEVALKVEDKLDPTCNYTRFINFSEGGSGTSYPPRPPKGTITDSRDGNTYCVVTLGGKRWFAENLRYSGGGSIGVCYDNSSECDQDGRLYTWFEVDEEDVCPQGWHVPSQAEWGQLLNAANIYGSPVAQELKSSSGWINGGNGGNYSRFDVRPAGCYTKWNNTFSKKGAYVGFWSTTTVGDHSAYSYNFAYDNWPSNSGVSVLERYDVKDFAHPCRCVED